MRLGESGEAQAAAIANSAGLIFELVAGPSEMKRGFELHAVANDFTFSHVNDRRDNLDFCLGLGSFVDHLLEGPVIVGAAIWITGAVFEDGADIDGVNADDFGPANGCGEKVSVAERNVSDGDGEGRGGGGRQVFGNGNVRVGEGGTADLGENVEMDKEAMGGGDGVEIGDFVESAAFAALGTLAVGAVKEGEAVGVCGVGYCSGYARVHTAAEQDDGGGLGVEVR